MSVDLDWSALDAQLTAQAIEFLTSAFVTAARPNFLGEVVVSTFSFGDAQPEIELIDIRDIDKEFLEVDDEEALRYPSPVSSEYQSDLVQGRNGLTKVGAGSRGTTGDWTNRVLPGQDSSIVNRTFRDGSNAGRHGRSGSYTPSIVDSILNPARRSIPKMQPSSALFSPGLHSGYINRSASPYFSSTPPPSSWGPKQTLARNQYPQTEGEDIYEDQDHYYVHSESPLDSSHDTLERAHHAQPHSHTHSPRARSIEYGSQSSSSPSPSLQLHVRVTYAGNLSIGLSTSLLINYPSPNFMSLPLKLSVTSLAFKGTFLIAYEGDRNRIHLSVLDPRDEPASSTDQSSTSFPMLGTNSLLNDGVGFGIGLTPGSRLLHGAVVESEVGQENKHVLKNVGKVEKFVLDVVRSTLESELVFPNFQTILF